MSRRNLLLVDDDATVLRSVSRLLVGQFHVVSTTDPKRALELVSLAAFDAVVTDIEMPGMNGVDLIRGIRTALGKAAPPLLVLTGSDVEVVEADVVLRKPADLATLAYAVHAAILRAERVRAERVRAERVRAERVRAERVTTKVSHRS